MKKRIFASMAVTLVMAAALATAAPAANLNKTTINVTVGSSVKVKIKGAKTANWSVKDTAVATVSAKTGKKVTVTGVKAGSTKLYAEVGGKTFKADLKVAEKAAAPAATTTSKIQEFANYVKSKGTISWSGKADVKNNLELKQNKANNWTLLPFTANGMGAAKNQSRALVFKNGGSVDYKVTITADANNLYFTAIDNYKEIDVRYVASSTDAPNINATTGTGTNVTAQYSAGTIDRIVTWCGYDSLNDLNTEDRYFIFGTIKDNSQMKVTVPLNGNAARATFAHNTDIDFKKGVDKSFAFYSEWYYDFAKEAYLGEAAYGWTMVKDQHDYLWQEPTAMKAARFDVLNGVDKDGTLWNALYGNKQALIDDSYAEMILGDGANPSSVMSYKLNSLMNVVDGMMIDQKTGFDLKTIGFNNFTNNHRFLYTDAAAKTAALYSVRWTNIIYY